MKKRKRILLMILVFLLPLSFCPAALSADGIGKSGDAVIRLTAEEKAFIEQHPVVYLGIDPSSMPYEFIDTDGEFKGITADYVELICKRTGLHMVPVQDVTWAAAYEMGMNKELDVLSCVAKTEERQQYFLFTDAYITFQRVIFVNSETNDIHSFKDLYGKSAAVQDDSSHEAFLSSYISIVTHVYPTVEEALEALSNGTETAFIGNLASTVYLSKLDGITNLKYISIENETPQELHFAVRNDWPQLVSILNKALESINQEERAAISNKWIGVEHDVNYSDLIRAGIIAGAVILLVIVVSAFWILKLQKEIKTRGIIQNELYAAKEEAEKANATKSLFLARMSHEIRTPLNAVMGMTHLMRKTNLSTTQKLYLNKLTEAANNMLGVINDILDFSKIEAGKIEIETVSFDLDQLLHRVVAIVSIKIEERGIDFSVHKDPDLPVHYLGDPTRIEQVLLNLVNNAVKFTEQGTVMLGVRADRLSDGTECVGFSVTDTGIGMTKKQLNNLFTPFYQADASINRRFGGTGLGMSITKMLCDLMHGEITVDSASGKGTSFLVRLPLAADVNRAVTDDQPISGFFENIRALVLSNDEKNLAFLRDCFRSFGIQAQFAKTEEQALDLLRQGEHEGTKHSRLLLVDFATPASGGIQFIRNVRASFTFSGPLKCILLAPIAREDLFEQTDGIHIDCGLTKPVLPSVLYDTIIDIFHIKHSSSQKLSGNTMQATAAKPYRVLLVEDNQTNQFIARVILEQAGFTVATAANGREGCDYFAAHRDELDLILMDLHMPVMDGYTAADKIREKDDGIPIVAMTADAIAGVRENCAAHGMRHYVTKPFDPHLLIHTLLEILSSIPEKRRHEESSVSADVSGRVLNTKEGVKHIGGDTTLYKLILQTYLDEAVGIIAELKAALDADNFALARDLAHKLKSSTGSIGSDSVYRSAAALQAALEQAQADEVQTLYNDFSSLFSQLTDEIRAYLTANGPA